jgi:ABC-type multidrug transport system fused ATPase/permease subunit
MRIHRPLSRLLGADRAVAQKGWALLTADECGRFFGLAFATAVVDALEIASVALGVTMVGIAVQPGLLTTSAWLAPMHRALGAPTAGAAVGVLAAATILGRLAVAWGSYRLREAVGRFGGTCANRLSRSLVERCLAAPYGWHLGQSTTALPHVLYDDVVAWGRGFVERMLNIVNAAAIALLSAIAVVAAIPGLGLLALVATGLVSHVVSRRVRPRLEGEARAKRRALDRMFAAATHALAGIKDVRLSSREGYFIDRFNDAFQEVARAQVRLGSLNLMPSLVMSTAGQVVFVAVTAGLALAGFSAGQIAIRLGLLTLVVSRLVPAVGGFLSSCTALGQLGPQIERIRALDSGLGAARRSTEAGAAPETIPTGWSHIDLDGLGYSYPGAARRSLEGVRIRIDRGVALGVAGRSGAGKSTLVDLVLGLLQPTEGRVLVDAQPLTPANAPMWQTQLAYVPQSPYLLDDTLAANVALGVAPPEVDRDRVRECLHVAGLDPLVAVLPGGLEAELGERGVRVSGGQRQRIAIARALYDRPQLLVLDEATSALDTVSEAEVRAPIASLRGRITTITIAHRLATLEDCDRILFLDEGRLLDVGTHRELVDRQPLYRKLAAGEAGGERSSRGL